MNESNFLGKLKITYQNLKNQIQINTNIQQIPRQKCKSKNNKIYTEIKESQLPKLHLEDSKADTIEENQKENQKENQNEINLITSEEFVNYGRIDKSDIHFQIISDLIVSI